MIGGPGPVDPTEVEDLEKLFGVVSLGLEKSCLLYIAVQSYEWDALEVRDRLLSTNLVKVSVLSERGEYWKASLSLFSPLYKC